MAGKVCLSECMLDSCDCMLGRVYARLSSLLSLHSFVGIERYNIQWCAYHCTAFRSTARNHESSAVSMPSPVQPPHGSYTSEKVTTYLKVGGGGGKKKP